MWKLVAVLGMVLGMLVTGCSKGTGASGSESSESSNSSGPYMTCQSKKINEGDNCGCDLTMPLDLSAIVPDSEGTPYETSFWPMGVHATTGHTEGHPGWDFTSAVQLDVVAPGNGYVRTISMNDPEDLEGEGVMLALDCGIAIYFGPIRFDEVKFPVGARFKKGETIGKMANAFGRWFLHYGTNGRGDETNPQGACPSAFYSADVLSKLQEMSDASNYEGKEERTVEITCWDGSTQTHTFPVETTVCAPRLPEWQRAQLQECIKHHGDRVW